MTKPSLSHAVPFCVSATQINTCVLDITMLGEDTLLLGAHLVLVKPEPPVKGARPEGAPRQLPNHSSAVAFTPQRIPSGARWMEQPAESVSAALRLSAWQQQHFLRVARSRAIGGTWRRLSLTC